MFVQVIKGKVKDADGFKRQLEKWRTELRPGATGFLGSTGGITDDGTMISFVRFEDEAAARANSDRPEQGAWWQETQQYVDGEPTFRESSDTSTLFDGGSDQAGFVQVMEGKVADRAATDATESPEMLEELRRIRPDLLGGLRVWFDDGEYAEVAYFTSEDDARKNEATSEFSQPQESFVAAFGEPTYIDLREPIFD